MGMLFLRFNGDMDSGRYFLIGFYSPLTSFQSPSYLKQKCTQFLTPFSGTVFYALSHGVIHFVQSVSFKNLKIEVFDWPLKNFNQRESGFSN